MSTAEVAEPLAYRLTLVEQLRLEAAEILSELTGRLGGATAEPAAPSEAPPVRDISREHPPALVRSSRAGRARPTYTEEQRADIIEYSIDHGVEEAHKISGVAVSTIHGWRKKLGRDYVRPPKPAPPEPIPHHFDPEAARLAAADSAYPLAGTTNKRLNDVGDLSA
jgi:transposase-like protein